MKKLNTKSDVYDLLSASTASAALGAAIETGLLWLLEDRRMDAESVAKALHIPLKRCHYWLQLLYSIGILEKVSAGYTSSFLTHAAILDPRGLESWQHLALDERERSEGVHNLALYIREPGSVWAAQGFTEPRDYVMKMKLDPERAREFTRMLYEVHQYLGNELAALLDLTGVYRLLDVGGGSGVVSMALLRQYPELTATVADIENVCIVGREIAAENSLADRIGYHPMDFAEDELPGGFDLLLLCDVGIFGKEFFRRLWAALNPGGRLVIVSHFPQEENSAPEARLRWTFLDSLKDPDFSYLTLRQTQAELVQAGFHLLPGQHTLTDCRIVVQAQKVKP